MKPSIRTTLIIAYLSAQAQALTWNNAGPTNNWSTAAGDANWDAGATWSNGSAATFSGTGETITLATAAMTASTATFSSSGYTLDFGANAMTWATLAGTGGFTKAGTGVLTLTGASTASGNVTINGGRVQLNNATALGSSAITLGNGAALTANAGLTVTNNITIGTGGGLLAGGAGDYANFNGVISGGTAGNTSLTINTGHTSLGNTGNNFSGNILLNAGYFLRTTASEVIPNSCVVNFTSTQPAMKFWFTTAGTYTETIGGINSTNAPYGVFAESSGPALTVNLVVGAGGATSSYTGPIWQYGGATLNLQKTGAGDFTHIQNGGNLYTGTTTVSEGKLIVGGGNAIPDAGAVTIGNTAGATLQLNASETIGSLSGGGGSGGAVDLQANALTIAGTAPTTFAGVISGTNGTLTKNAAGTLTLAGVNTYTGATTVNAGTLLVSGSLDAGSAVTVGSTATLGGTGVVGGDVISSGTIAPGSSTTPANLTLDGNVTLNAGTLAFDVSGASCDHIQLSGDTVTANGPVTISLVGTPAAGDYTIISGAAGTIDTSNFTVVISGAFSTTLDNSTPGSLVVHVVNGNTLIWNGTSGVSDWDVSTSSNWLNGVTPTVFTNGDIVNFTEAATERNIVLNANVAPSGITFNHTSDYSIVGTGGISGNTGIVKQGTGTLLLSTNNTYLGTTEINDGTIRLDYVTALGATTAGTTVAAGARLDLYGLGIPEPVTLAGVLENTYAGDAILSGTLQLTGTPEVAVASYPVTISGVASGTAGFTKTGVGTLTVSGANTLSGNITVTAGKVVYGSNGAAATTGPLGPTNTTAGKVTVANGASVNFNGQPDTSYGYTIAGSGVSGEGALHNAGSAITPGMRQASNITLSANASIGGTGEWALASPAHAPNTIDLAGFTLTKTGSNTITLVTTTFTPGSVAVDQGTLRLGWSGGAAGPISGGTAVDFTVNGGTILVDANSAAIGSLAGGSGTVTIGSTRTLTTGALNTSTTFGGVVTGAGSLTKTGTGTLTLAGVNTYTGNTTVNGGTLALASGSRVRFVPNNTASNKITGSAAADLGGTFVIAPQGITVTTGTWTLVDTNTLSETYSGGFSVIAPDETPWTNNAGVWTHADASGMWTFTQSTGQLTLAPNNTFDSWMGTFTFAPGADTTATGDADGDGISNLVEHVMGTAPNAPTTGVTQVTGTAGTLVFKHSLNASIASNVTYGYQWSTDLAEWKSSGQSNTGGTTVTIGATTTVGVSTVTSTVTGGSSPKVFVRIVASTAP